MTDTRDLRKSYARRFVRGSGTVFSAMIISSVTGLILRIFLARTLTASEYGILYSAIGFVIIFGQFRDFGLGQALVKYVPEFAARKQYKYIKSSMLLLIGVQATFSACVSILVVTFSDQISTLIFGSTVGASTIRILTGWFFMFSFFYSFKGTFQGLQDMTAYSSLNVFEIFLPFIFIISLVPILGGSSAIVSLGYLLGMGTATLVAFLIFLKKYGEIIRAKYELPRAITSKLYTFAVPAFATGIAGTIIGYMNIFMINVLYSSEKAGIFFAVQPIAELLMFIPLAMGSVLFPLVSELWARKQNNILKDAIAMILKASVVLIVPLALVSLAFPETVIFIIMGDKYLSGAWVLRFMTVNVIVSTLNTLLNRTILGLGKPVAIAKTTGVMAITILIANLIFIPPYGIEGAAVASFCAIMASFIVSLYYARKFIKLNVPWVPMVKAVLGGILTLAIIWWLKMVINLPYMVELFVVMVPSLLIYTTWILLTRAITRSDLSLLRDAILTPKKLLKSS